MRIAEDVPDQGALGWMVTYGDMMSLLLTFFILLVSMSEFRKNDKFQGVADSMQKHFGGGRAAALLEEWRPRDAALAAVALLGRAKRQAELKFDNRSSSAQQSPAITLVLSAEAAGLDQPSRDALRQFAQPLTSDRRIIEIRVAATAPMSTAAANSQAWDRSFGIAQQAAGVLRDEVGIPHDRLRLTIVTAPLRSESTPELPSTAITELSLALLDDRAVDLKSAYPAPPAP